MLSYASLQDALTAAVVILAVLVVLTAAWLSTHVREQPLVATAVVVFHSGAGATEEGARTSDGAGSSAETQGGSVREGEAAPLRMPTQAKDSEAPSATGEVGMEVRQVPNGDVTARTQIGEAGEGRQCNEGSTNTSDSDLASASAQGSTIECISQEPASGEDCADSSLHLSEAPLPERSCRELPEMEVRKRRFQHFISMGETTGSAATATASEFPAAPEATQDCTQEPQTGTTVEEVCGSEGKGGSMQPTQPTHPDTPSLIKEKQQDEEEEEEEPRPPGSIKIRLKFLDETQRHVFAQLTEQVGTFKRQHFSIEMDANRRIRLIFNGQLLSQDSSTLAQYGLFDNCVVHCHVSQPQMLPRTPGHSGEAAAHEEEDAYVSRLLAPLLYCVMVVMWYLRYEYGHLFNTMSTIILLFLTALLLVSTYLLYITQHVPQSEAATSRIPASNTRSAMS